MARREGAAVRHVDEGPRLPVDEGRTLPGDPLPQEVREPVGGEVGGQQKDEEPRAAPEQREHGARHEEDQAVGPDPRQFDEEPVEPSHPVPNDPALEMAVERGQF